MCGSACEQNLHLYFTYISVKTKVNQSSRHFYLRETTARAREMKKCIKHFTRLPIKKTDADAKSMKQQNDYAVCDILWL
jgi:hypothetical protein